MHSKVLEHAGVFSAVRFGPAAEFGASRAGGGSAWIGGVRAAGELRRRLDQLRFVEERLRPLRETPLERVYRQVFDELERLRREIEREDSPVGS